MKRNSKAGERRSAAQMHALAAVRREIVLRDSCGGRKYLREFTQAFRQYQKALSPEAVDQKINEANIVLIGDYHALAASPRYAASVIEKVSAKRSVVLCLEAVLSRDQGIVESWWRREIGEEELRKRLRFDREWGYEWQPSYDLLSAARDHAEAIYGLDCMPRDDMRRIRSRDRHAAAKVGEARREHPDAAIVVLFGESHLAPEHLPKLIRQNLPDESLLTILQNVDTLYWQAVGEDAAAASIGPDTICVFNSSPLEKYESYRLCLERWNGDDQTDFAPAVYNVIFSLARALGFRLDSPHNGTQPKYLADSLPEVVSVESEDGNPSTLMGECARITRAIETGCRYVPDTNQFFIREFNMPQVAAEAARFLYHACHGLGASGNSNLSIASNTLAHFGSRLLCPEPTQVHCENDAGEELYQSYIAGRTPRSTVRRMFLRG